MKEELSEFNRLNLELKNYENEFREWYFQCDKIITKYSDQRNTPDRNAKSYKKFNILWANVETLKPNVYARLPQVEVERIYKDVDPISRVASIVLERLLTHCLKHKNQFHEVMEACVKDRLLGGRGTIWLRYEPHSKSPSQPDGVSITENKDEFNSKFPEVNEMEYLAIDYVHHEDFGHSYARIWSDVNILWRIVYLNKDQCIARFGEKVGNEIPIDSLPNRLSTTSYGDPYSKEIVKQAKIYEIWDKTKKKVYWLNKSMSKILDEVDDPLKLDGFFPCPRPLYATLSNNTLKPTPDYIYYRDMSDMLDSLVQKESKLIEALQLKGVYDGAFPELKRLFTEADMGELVGVKNWAAMSEKGGMLSSLQLIDLKPIYEAIATVNAQIEMFKNIIYDITGISDILRGQSQEYETAAAQKMKSTNGNGRLKTRQMEIVQFATDIIKLGGEIIASHFSDDNILQIINAENLQPQDQQLLQPALQLIKDKYHLGFKIEITSDSMIFANQLQEREDRIQYMNVASGFMKQFIESAMQSPEIAPMMGEMVKFSLQPFRVGKTLEGVIDTTINNLIQKSIQMAQNPPPNPEIEKEKMRIQAEMQKEQQRIQAEMEMKQLELQHEIMMEDKDLQIEYAKVKLQENAKEKELALQSSVKEKEFAMQIQKEEASQRLQAEESALRIALEKERNIATEQAEIEKERMRIENETKRDILIAAQKNITDIEKERIKLGMSDGRMIMQQNLSILGDEESKITFKEDIQNMVASGIDKYRQEKKPAYKTIKDGSGRFIRMERIQ